MWVRHASLNRLRKDVGIIVGPKEGRRQPQRRMSCTSKTAVERWKAFHRTPDFHAKLSPNRSKLRSCNGEHETPQKQTEQTQHRSIQEVKGKTNAGHDDNNMKRSRTTQDDVGTVSKTKQPKKAAATLEEVRAKLEQARLKKIAAEERLLRQKQQDSLRFQQQGSVPPSSSAIKSATTVAITSETSGTGKTTMATKQENDDAKTLEGILSNLSNNASTRAKKAQEALDRARSKLQGALQNRERALLQQRMKNVGGTFDSSSTTNGSTFNKSSNAGTSWNRKRWSLTKQNNFSYKQQGRDVTDNGLPPISALSPTFQLRVTDIGRSGPPSMVYHNIDNVGSSLSSTEKHQDRAELVAALGGNEAVEDLHRSSDWYYSSGEDRKSNGDGENTGDVGLTHTRSNDTTNDDDKKPAATITKKQKLTSASLLQRKLQLQNELMALKEKLEMKASEEPKQKKQNQKEDTETTAPLPNEDTRSNETPTKEGLERRKAEAQTLMDISYWKHFVSKQEHLLEQVTSKINDMDDSSNPRGSNSYREFLNKRHATNKEIAKVQQDLEVIEKRHEVVEQGIAITTQKLLESRQALYEERNRKLIVKNNTHIATLNGSNDHID